MKKTLSVILLAILVMTQLFASGGKEDAVETIDGHEVVNLRFMWWGGDDRAKATIAVIDAFEAKYPWIKVEPEYSSSDGYQEKLTTRLSSGNAPDIIQMGPGWLPGYVQASPNAFINFDDYTDKFDLSGFEEGFLKQNGNINGKQFGIPTGISGYSFIYNKTLADKVGIKFPESKDEITWDTLLELGRQVKAADPNVYLLDADESSIATCIIRPYMLQLTGNTMVVDETVELGFTEAELLECLTFIKAMYDNNVLPPLANIAAYSSGDALQTDPKWIAGNTYIGMFLSSSTADVAAAACPGSEFVAGYMPVMEDALDDGYYLNCPQYMVIPTTTKHLDEALLFLDYFYNSEEAAGILTTVRSVPPTYMAQRVCAEMGVLEGLAKETVDLIQPNYHGTNEMGLTTQEEFTQILKDIIGKIAFNQGSIESITKDGMKQLQSYVELKK